MRLDTYLVAENFTLSRNKAQELIAEGIVLVNGREQKKSSYKVQESDKVTLKEHKSYLSRAAYKLSGFLEDKTIDATRALDIGSSTGGFTQVLLEKGVDEVWAVDVGTSQLHPHLKQDTRVRSFENCDIRDFTSDIPFPLIVSDISFISLLHILDKVDSLACGVIILLFKPQFEVGREASRDRNGVVLDAKAIANAMQKFELTCQEKKWRLMHKEASQITGKEGNLEYCYWYEK
ncbi:MAG: TlyA family RNA methyltransferase [Sulfurimonadaceae bacterium]|jgi:23S rRNA (cytidine1920-2'-O)/16S rRNA (cytidine1409-2'-O)-methyltransferase|nr:TlyA family RNA methyltransferase [Sulfurimonadaceae bacterium]